MIQTILNVFVTLIFEFHVLLKILQVSKVLPFFAEP